MQSFAHDLLAKSKQADPLPLDRIAVIILGGGEGKRLEPLTKYRCKPAVAFGGRYTLIDVPISHALSSGLKQLFVIGQYLAESLGDHIDSTYQSHEKIQLLLPSEVNYKGTADAIRQNLSLFDKCPADYFLILSGDHLYNINFQEMIRFGLEAEAGMVIAAQPVNEKNAKRMGLLKLEKGGTRLVDFVEKPKEKPILENFCHGRDSYLGSMGIYFFKRDDLFGLLKNDPRADFGMHLIETQMRKGNVHAYLYDGYWEDIGTIESYYAANLALTERSFDKKSGFYCYDERYLIQTKVHHLPGASIEGTRIHKSLVAEGAIIEAEEIVHSIVGRRSVLRSGVIVRDSILIGNEFYDAPRRPEIGKDSIISKAIIDENVTIGVGVRLLNLGQLIQYDSPAGSPPLHVRDGILIVPKGALIPDGFVF